mgnify:FL=1
MFGDFSFKNDIELVYGNSLKEEYVLDRIKSGYMSYRLNENYGADLDTYIGKGITADLITTIERSINYSLTYDGYISDQDLSIIILETDKQNELYIRVVIQGSDVLNVSTTINLGGENTWVLY